MTFMVIMSFRQNTDLVTTDYYAEELIFQQQIDASNNAKPFMDSIIIKAEGEMVNIKFPSDFYSATTGEVYFYKASDSEYDHKYPLELNATGMQQFNKSTLQKDFIHLRSNGKRKIKSIISKKYCIVIALFITAFVTGLFGSLHCAGMCGPLALSFNMQNTGNTFLMH